MKKLFVLFIINIVLTMYLFPLNAYGQTNTYKTESNPVNTTIGNATLPGGPAGNFVYYCQSDPRWSNICSIGLAGCGPTSMAMVLTYFGETITPPEMDAIFQRRGWRVCGDNPSRMPTAIGNLVAERNYDMRTLSIPLNLTQAKEVLDAGYLIIGSVSTHIFVVDGVNLATNQVHMQDPARRGCEAASAGGYLASNSAPWGGQPWYYAYALKKQ